MINSLRAISVAIKKNIVLSLFTLLIISLSIINLIYFKNINLIELKNTDEIVSNFDLLKANLSEKISLIANSTVFVDYLRSGSESRHSLKSDFTFSIRSSKPKEVSGIVIESNEGEKIFSDGTESDYSIKMPLCYFDRGLDSKLGACLHDLILYFDKNEVVKSLHRINDKLIACETCVATDFLSSKKFGSFNVVHSSRMPLLFKVKYQQSFNIVTINLIVLIVMVVLAGVNWRRANFILDRYLSDPITEITLNLKNGDKLFSGSRIDELEYLVNQIKDREEKINQAMENENYVVVGRLASQFAHDIRSPLAVINAIIERTSEIPNEKRMLIYDVTQQANNIANSLLSMYQTELANHAIHECYKNTNKFSDLLNLLIKEKKVQYENLPIELVYRYEECENALININHVTDFKRVISNIINNSIEAIQGTGSVTVELTATSKVAIVNITDNGIGMRVDLIQKILSGKSISSKKSGAGIGLVSACSLIKSWGGNVHIASQPNIGTTVSLTVPIVPLDLPLSDIKLESPDLILIDDNEIVSNAWKFYAIHNKKNIVIFNRLENADHEIRKFDRGTPIYIDSDLGASIRGEQYAEYLYELGFTNIFLTTGHADSSFPNMPWIKKIIGKDPASMCHEL